MANAASSPPNASKGCSGRCSVNIGAIPQELRDLPQWVTWRLVQRNGNPKPTKVPINPTTGLPASTTDPSSWVSFDDALASYHAGHIDGIGFVFAPDDPYTGIDLDKCYDEAGHLVSWAQDLVTRFDSYTELSPSGHGLHIIIRGKLPERGRRKGPIEMYSEGRYFTMTGVWLEGTSSVIAERSDVLQTIYQEVFAEDDDQWSSHQAPIAPPNIEGDDDLITRACEAKNGGKFQKLWQGDISDYGSPSEADLALCNHLNFWTGGDPQRMDRLFRRSGLMRPKWDEEHGAQTYGAMTITKARPGAYSPTPGRQLVNGEDVVSITTDASPNPQVPQLPDGVWTGWLENYRDWVLPTTDGAIEAMFACGSVDLALAIGRNVGVYYGRPTYPNLFIDVVGATGVSRKSTLQTRGQGVRQGAFANDFVRVSRSIGSGEGLLERFCNEEIDGDGKNKRVVLMPIPGQRVLLDEPEFTNLLKKARRPGTANITEILLSLFDGDDINPNTRKRPINVVEPFLCIVTATTPESLETVLEDIDIDSGLIPRFATFWCSPREPLAYPPPPDEEKLRHLSTDLAAIGNFAAEVGASQQHLSLSPAARSEWEITYRDLTQATRDAAKAVGAIMTRVPSMIMKWALLYAVQAGHAVIELDDLARGQLVGDYLMQTAELVPSHISKTPVAKVEAKILDVLAKEPGKYLPVSAIHKMVSGRIKAQELRQSLGALVELGRIEQGKTPNGKPAYRII